MSKTYFFILALLTAVLGFGAGAMAQSAPPAAASVTLGESHFAKGVKCNGCHDTAKFAAVATSKCLTCHGDGKVLAQRTAKVKPTNPHDNRHYGTEADCNLCHQSHVQSKNACLVCHWTFTFKVP